VIQARHIGIGIGMGGYCHSNIGNRTSVVNHESVVLCMQHMQRYKVASAMVFMQTLVFLLRSTSDVIVIITNVFKMVFFL